MSEIQPQGEDLRKAVRWASDRRQDEDCPPLFKLVEQACMKFDLSPSDAEFLQRFLKTERP